MFTQAIKNFICDVQFKYVTPVYRIIHKIQVFLTYKAITRGK